MIEQSHYNTYSSARYSNTKRTMYLALNKRGQSKKVQIKAQQQLGKLSTYTRVLTQPVSPERVEDLINRLMSENGNASHPLRHHGSSNHLCSSSSAMLHKEEHHLKHSDAPGVDRLRCRKRKKRKKKRRRFEEEPSVPKKSKPMERAMNTKKNIKKCEHINKNDECQRVGTNVNTSSNSSRLVSVKKSTMNKKLGGVVLEGVRKNNNKKTKKKKPILKNGAKKNPTLPPPKANITEIISPVEDQGKEEDSRQVELGSADTSSSWASTQSAEENSWEINVASTSAMETEKTDHFLLEASSPRTTRAT